MLNEGCVLLSLCIIVAIVTIYQVAEKFPDKSSKLVLGCQMGARSAKVSYAMRLLTTQAARYQVHSTPPPSPLKFAALLIY